MKILFLSTWFPCPPDNGSKIRVYYLLRALSVRHEVTLLSFAFDTAQPAEATEPSNICAEAQTVAVNPFKRTRVSTLARFLSPDPIVTHSVTEMKRATQRLLDARPYEAIIASTEVMATYAQQASQTITKILEEHNSLSRWMHERYRAKSSMIQGVRRWLSWRKTTLYESRLFRRFDLCTMVSDQDRAACLQMLPRYHGSIEVVPNGVDCERNRLGLAVTEPSGLVFNGALTYQANYDAAKYFLQEIFPIIQARQSDVTLSITGSTKSVNLGGLALSNNVKLTGYMDDIRLLVAGSSVCVVPIRGGGGTRIKILEAMALGTPVVSTTKGAEGIAVRHGEHLLLADDAASFAECTLNLMRDPGLRQRLVSNARHLVEESYDWKIIGERFAGLVEDVVKRQAN